MLILVCIVVNDLVKILKKINEKCNCKQIIVWIHIATVVNLIVHVFLLLQIIKSNDLVTLIFIIIVATPPVLNSILANYLSKICALSVYSIILSVVYLVVGTYAYIDAIYVHPDPQNGLVFIVLPILGLIFTFILSAAIFYYFKCLNQNL